MARPPAGPMGNSPRDVRDDAVGIPAENVDAPEPPRWPPKPKKITRNDFHAKVSGGKPPRRADRSPHFRKGGWVKGYASGGVIAKREELPSEKKNDPFAKQNLRGGGSVKKKLADGGDVEPKGGWKSPDKKMTWPADTKPPPDDWRRLGPEPTPTPPHEEPKPGFLEREFAKGRAVFGPKRKSGGAVKKADGGEIDVQIGNKPPVMPDKPFEHTGSQEPGPGLPEEEFPQKLARGINTVNRTIGNAPNRGALDVQKYADMKRAKYISDVVPRRQEEGVAGPSGIGSRKSGGKVK
jgi:hypothetical protein